MSPLQPSEVATALIDASSDPMWALDAQLALCAFNQAFVDLVHKAFGAEPVLGSTVDDLPPPVATQHRAAYERVLQGGTLSFDWALDDLAQIWAVRLVPILRDDEVVGIAATGHDVTEREATAAELRAARAAAERANAAKSEFLAAISHELRTPLNVIIGLTEVADTQVGPGQQPLIGKVKANARSLLGLVTDLLDFSQIEAGELEIEPVLCDLRPVVSEIVEAHRAQAVRKGIELAYTVDGAMPRQVEIDPTRVAQIAGHLVSNAVRFTQSGRVAVELGWVPAQGGPGRVQLTVRDTGIGISAREQRLIFTRFYRSYRSVSERQTGTGLGLAITKAVVEQMQGAIRLRSEPGRGSVFSVRLPVGRAVPLTEDPTPAPVARGPARILIADDNPDNLRITRALLERDGHRVFTVPDGEAALDASADQDFDLIVMDVEMAPMDGVRATIEIRAREELLGLPRVPIVALTAHVVPEVRERCMASGMDDFLAKPVDEQRLRRAVERWAAGAVPTQPVRTLSAPARQVDPCIADLVPEFLEERRQDVVALRQACERGDADWVRHKAHQIRGTGTSYGYPELTELGGALEDAAREADTARMASLIDRIDAVLAT